MSDDRFQYSESVRIAASPQALYELVTDVARTGEWSPVCRACWWAEGDGPSVGAWFYGRNESDGHVWETESQVVAATPGVEFAWTVGGRFVRWGFAIAPSSDGATLTESWHFLPEGREMFQRRYASEADGRIEMRTQQARAGIPATLAAIKRIAEG